MNNNHFSTSLKLTQIDVNNLRIGMYVSKLDRLWLETNFLFQGFEIKTTHDLKEIQEQCDYVFIDVQKQIKTLNPPTSSPLNVNQPVASL